MKTRWLAGVLVACLFLFLEAIRADALSPPKKMCALDKTSGNLVFAVTCKPNGKLRSQHSSVTHYLLTGLISGGIPTVGSGYVFASGAFGVVLFAGHTLYANINLENGEGAYSLYPLGGGGPISGDLELKNCLELP